MNIASRIGSTKTLLSRPRNNPIERLARKAQRCALFLVGCLALSALPAWSDEFQVLHTFGTKIPDAKGDYFALNLGPDDRLYGISGSSTPIPGEYGNGVIYRISDQRDFEVIHQFCDLDYNCPLGDQNSGLELGPDGKFYGISSNIAGQQFVFRMSTEGQVELFSELGLEAEYWVVEKPLTYASDGYFYGVSERGTLNECGFLFRISPAGESTKLYGFSDLDDDYRNDDGCQPLTPLIESSNGYLYGAAGHGGRAESGVLFKLSKQGEYTLLHTFAGIDGELPYGPLAQDANGDIYGTTLRGGAYQIGVAFRLRADDTFEVVHEFGAGTGRLFKRRGSRGEPAWPSGFALGVDGALYGTSYFGGKNNVGSVYKMDKLGAITVLHSFAPWYDIYTYTNRDGARPVAVPTVGADGALYGTTTVGGWTSEGTIWRVDPAE